MTTALRKSIDITVIFVLTIYGLIRPKAQPWVMKKSKEIVDKHRSKS